jgi:hypothetical protein
MHPAKNTPVAMLQMQHAADFAGFFTTSVSSHAPVTQCP